MIDARCECGVGYRVPETETGTVSPPCPRCGRLMRIVSAEKLPDGAGAGDFDTRLVVVGGPDRIGEQIVLGGCCEIEIGKLPQRHVQLGGEKVSRLHCKLVRLDFGPSRWQIQDNHSTNGLFLNGQRLAEPRELKDGDVIQVGEYSLRYGSDAAAAAVKVAAPVEAIPVGGPECPNCKKALFAGALACIDCGIYVPSGRPLITARAIDQERVDEIARETVWTISWFTFMGFLPVASEAFGTVKPRAVWSIAAVTVLCSVLFFPVSCNWVDRPPPVALNLMQWSGHRVLLEQEVQKELFVNTFVNGMSLMDADRALVDDVLLETMGDYAEVGLGNVEFFGTIFTPTGDLTGGQYSTYVGKLIAGEVLTVGTGAVINPIPEPAALAPLALGLVALLRRRRQC